MRPRTSLRASARARGRGVALALGLGVGLAVTATASVASAGTVTNETHQGLSVRVFTPSAPSPKALVLMLHGCTQAVDAFAAATQIEALAETEGFVVAFPQELDSAPNRCWQWWDPANQKRGAGEPQVLGDTISEIVQQKGLDPDRVYVAGISAGAAMTVILGVTYPDRVAAIGVVAGLEYGAASSLSTGVAAPGSGGPDPNTQGDAAFAEMGSLARVVPTFVIHGTSDRVVFPLNGDQIVQQWLRVDTDVLGAGTIAAPTTTEDTAGYAFSRSVHRTVAEHAPVVVQVVVEGLGHAWPGGLAGGSFSDPKGPDATKLLWDFFAPRTKSAPLVDTPDPPVGGGTPTTTPTPVADPGPNDSPSTGAPSSSSSSSSGGGCASAPRSSGTGTGTGTGVTVVGGLLGLVLARRRRRSLVRSA